MATQWAWSDTWDMNKVIRKINTTNQSHLVMSNSLQPHEPARFFYPCNSPARILEWVAIPFSRGSSRPRGWAWVSCIAGRFLTIWATREAHKDDMKVWHSSWLRLPAEGCELMSSCQWATSARSRRWSRAVAPPDWDRIEKGPCFHLVFLSHWINPT